MTTSRFFFLFLWVAPHVLQILIIVIMVRRKMLREFPIFFCLHVFPDIADRRSFYYRPVGPIHLGALHPQLDSRGIYQRGAAFAVIHEIFQNVFRSYPALQQLGGRLVRWSTVLLMIAAVLLVAYSTGTNLDRVSLVLVVVNRTVNIMQVGLLVLLLLLVKYLHLSWSTFVFPLALGLGLYASAMLVNTALQAHYRGFLDAFLTNQIEHGAYSCCVLVWLTGLLLPQPQPSRLRLRRSMSWRTGTLRYKGCYSNDHHCAHYRRRGPVVDLLRAARIWSGADSF